MTTTYLTEGLDPALDQAVTEAHAVAMTAIKPDLTPEPLRIDLGCGPNKQPGHIGLDRIAFEGVDHVLDIGLFRWPFENDSVDEAYSSHCVEHLTALERIRFFNELHRVLKLGAKAKIITPHWSTCRAYGDPTHKWPPIGEFFYMYLSRDWRLGNEERGIRANAPHTDVTHWVNGYACDFEMDMSQIQYGVNKMLANRNPVFRQFAENHYREYVFDIIVTLTKR